MKRRGHSSFNCATVLAIGLLLASSTTVMGQAAARPNRGAMPTGSYAVSEIENISLTNGNLNIGIPLASLPPVAGGKLGLTLRAEYNSKLWDTVRTERQNDPLDPATKHVISSLQISDQGGWRIGAGYSISFESVTADYRFLPPAGNDPEYNLITNNYWAKVVLTTPDGATHELRPVDYLAYEDGYFNHPYLRGYYKDTPRTVNGSVRYYSFDGSHIWAKVDNSQYCCWGGAESWTLYLPDGTKVEQLISGEQRITDTNGNKVKFFNAEVAGVPTSHIQDEQTGREIRITYDAAGNGGQGQGQIQYQTVGGEWKTIAINYGSTHVFGKRYQFGDLECAEAADYVDTQTTVIRSIVYPPTEPGQAGRQFTFTYNSDTIDTVNYQWRTNCWVPYETVTSASHGWGSLSEIAMPTGATVNYTYGLDGEHYLAFNPDAAPSEAVGSKTLTHDGTSEAWSYDSNPATGGFTAPDGSFVKEWRYPSDPGFAHTNSGFGGKEELVYRTNSSNKVMVERHWTLMRFTGGENISAGANVEVAFNPVVDAEYTTLLDDTPNHNPVKMSARTYLHDYNGNVIQTTEYDWFDPALVTRDAQGVPTGMPASASVLRVVDNEYHHPATIAGSANVYAKRLLPDASHPDATPLILDALHQTTGPSITQLSYDGQAYGIAPTVGNLTSQSVWDDLDSKWITSSQTYDLYGNLATKTDPRGKVTQFFYDDATHALPNRVVVDPENGTGTQTMTTAFDYSTGLVTSQTDPNNNVSTVSYTNQLLGTVDPFGRPGVTIGPLVNAGGPNQHHTVTTTYEDHLLRVTVAADLNTESDKLLKTRTTADMLGRPILTEQTEDGTNYTISARKVYDVVNRMTFSSGPMRSGAASTDSWTRVTTDIAGRMIEAATFAGSAQPSASPASQISGWTGSVTTSYEANFTTVADQAGKQRRSMVDALGRLLRVDEPDASNSLGTTAAPAQATSYVYDIFGNLLTVNQGAQTRTFTYDSLSRLRSAVSPESGTISYSYDDNGNLLTKTDARSIVSTYVYDALNRATSRSYSDTTPAVTYSHDSTTIINGKGRLASVSSSVSTYSYSGYDAVGKPLGGSQTLGSQTYSFSNAYDLSGHVTSMTYPSGRVVNYNYDNAGRLADKDATNLAFTGNLGDSTTRTYAKGITYDPGGQMAQEQFGTTTAVFNKLFYNSRGQLAEILAATSGNDTTFNRGKIINYYSLQCGGVSCNASDNNGNLRKQSVFIPNNDQNTNPTSWYQQYDYDSLNRLQRAHEYTGNTQLDWQQEFVYDRYGNRKIDTNVTATYGGVNNLAFEIKPDTPSESDNRLYAPGDLALNEEQRRMQYDPAGNLEKDTYTGAGDRIYDAENHMTKAWANGQWQEYTYSGTGQRVRRKVDGVETWQVYGLGGELLAEYAANASPSSPQKEYGYRNGQLLITAEPAFSSAVAPSGLGSSPASSTVTLNWTAASGATNYRVERKAAGGSYSYAGNSATTGFVDNGVSSGNAYLYRVCAADNQNNCTSDYSNVAVGAAFTFPTDPTITSIVEDPTGVTVTPMRAAHITELRTAVNAVRSLAGLAAATWTHASVASGGTIYVEDVRDLRERLGEALNLLGINNPTYTDPIIKGFLEDPLNATPIKAAHIRELRQASTSGSGSEGGGGGSSTPNIRWLVADQLGTPRMIFDESGSLTVTDANGNYVSGAIRHDYLPFGEELFGGPPSNPGVGGRLTTQGYSVGDNVRQKFTSKERDNETGLDYFEARYYASIQGRFISVDPYNIAREVQITATGDPKKAKAQLDAYLSFPQQWNRYGYTANNPLKYVDPSGQLIELTGATQAERDEALNEIRWLVGKEAGKHLGWRQEKGKDGKTHYYVTSDKNLCDVGSLSSTLGYYISEMIDRKDHVVELQIADSFTTRFGKFTTEGEGGASTVGAEESWTGNTQIFLNRDSSAYAEANFNTVLHRGSFSPGRGHVWAEDDVVLAHEFGHAYANAIEGKAIRNSRDTYDRANEWENLQRGVSRYADRTKFTRIHHN